MDASQFGADTPAGYERETMIHVTLAAPTPKEAYGLAREKYGENFDLISARQLRYSEEEGLISEITIAVSKERFLQLEEIEGDEGESQDTTEEDLEEGLMEEISLLREQIALMKGDLLRRQAEQETLIEKVKTLFSEKGIASEWLEGVLEPLIGSTVAEDEKLLVAYLLEEIDETLQVKAEVIEGQKVMMFVGPTGVGKTTTIAKLAARYAYMMEKPYRVALLNLDSYKVGAFEQLAHFADIMQLEYFSASNVEEFTEAFAKMDAYDIVLIDTAGMSPYDTEKLVKTVEYLSADTAKRIEVNLLIAATVKYEDIHDIYETFSFLNLESVILSKFDETKHLGTVLSYLLLHPIPLSYFSIGQEVPDDLIVADKEYLLQRFIGDLDG
jgi:flagellar biosynthesis protein FlhF